MRLGIFQNIHLLKVQILIILAPSLTNTSHSQVLQDTLVAETQSFSQSQRTQFKVPETIDITMVRHLH